MIFDSYSATNLDNEVERKDEKLNWFGHEHVTVMDRMLHANCTLLTALTDCQHGSNPLWPNISLPIVAKI